MEVYCPPTYDSKSEVDFLKKYKGGTKIISQRSPEVEPELNVCETIKEGFGRSKEIRKVLVSFIALGYSEGQKDAMMKVLREIEAVKENLEDLFEKATTSDMPVLCYNQVAVKNGILALESVTNNLTFIMENQECRSASELISSVYELFSTYTLSLLGKMQTECYSTVNEMRKVTYTRRVKTCTPTNSNRLMIGEIAEELLQKSEYCFSIIDSLFSTNPINEETMSDDLRIILRENYREIVNKGHLLWSQMDVTEKSCSSILLATRLIEANRLAATMRRLINRDMATEPCERVHNLSIYYEMASKIAVYLKEVHHGVCHKEQSGGVCTC